jgi:hypothetical protein
VAGDAPAAVEVQVVALAHGVAVVTHTLDPDGDAGRLDRGVPLDDPARAGEASRQCGAGLVRPAQSPAAAGHGGIEDGLGRVGLRERRELTGLDAGPQPFGNGLRAHLQTLTARLNTLRPIVGRFVAS